MINVHCDHCKKEIRNPRTEKEKNFFQVLDNYGKVECDLCKDCYDLWCKGLNSIEERMNKSQRTSELKFKEEFLHKR